MNAVMNFVRDEDGAALIEYGLIAALVAVAAIAGLTAVGNQLSAMFTSISGTLATATGS